MYPTLTLRQLGTKLTTGPFGTVLSAAEYVDDGIPLVNPTHISNGRIVPDGRAAIGPVTAARLHRHALRVGDLVMGRKGEVGRTALVGSREDGWICGSDSIAVRTDRSRLVPAFLKWIMASPHTLQQLEANSSGATVDGINERILLRMPVPVPVVAIQGAVAAFLDVETARIDAVAVAYRRQLGLLAMRKRAAVSDALTSHSDRQVPVRRLVSMVTSGPRGWSGLEVEGYGRPFLRIANVPADSIALTLDDVALIDAPRGDESVRCRVQPGDVLMTITAAIGQVAVVPGDLGEAYISQHLALLRPNPVIVMPDWLALALWSDDAQRQLDAARYGGTKQQLSLEDVREVCVPVAEMTVQRSVVPRVVASLEAVTQAEQRIGRMIDLIIERRQALITAAVTGQIEIPGVAA